MPMRWLFALLFVPLSAMPGQAGVLFGKKKDRPDPKQRVPELVGTLKTDKDADRRAKAAEELRLYDPAVFAELVPALLAALGNDPASSVRIEAAHSLSKLRPVTNDVGEALEQSVSKDSSMRVRLQARSALLQYHWAGYRGKKGGDVPPPLTPTTKEPPIAGPEKEPTPPPISTTPAGPLAPPVLIIPNTPLPVGPLPLPPANDSKPKETTPKKDRSPLEDLPPVPPLDKAKPKADGGPEL